MTKPRFDTMTEEGLRVFFATHVEGKTAIQKKEVADILDILNDPLKLSKLPLCESLGSLERRIMLILHDFCGYSWTATTWSQSYTVEGERIEPLRVILTPKSRDFKKLDMEALGEMISKSVDWTIHEMKKCVTVGTRATIEIDLKRKRC